jgi:hypothetical protein
MRFTVKLYTLPPRDTWVGGQRPACVEAPGFTVDERNVDKAMREARKRLEERAEFAVVRSVNAAPDRKLVAYVEEAPRG